MACSSLRKLVIKMPTHYGLKVIKLTSISDPPQTALSYKNPCIKGTSGDDSNDWLDMQCSYADLCNQINRSFLSTNSTRPRDTRNVLVAGLQKWYHSIPNSIRSDDEAIAITSQTRQLAVHILYHYLEACLAILDIPGDLAGPVPTALATVNKERASSVLSDVKEVFVASNKIEYCWYYRYDELSNRNSLGGCLTRKLLCLEIVSKRSNSRIP